MPLIWGRDEPGFASLNEANAILGAIMARCNQITANFDTDPDAFDPVFLEGQEDQVIVSYWAAGFMDAVILQAKAWAPILDDADARALMLRLPVLGSDDERPLFDAASLPEDELEKLLAGDADIIMDAVPVSPYLLLRRGTIAALRQGFHL